jgi:hypothetical protein
MQAIAREYPSVRQTCEISRAGAAPLFIKVFPKPKPQLCIWLPFKETRRSKSPFAPCALALRRMEIWWVRWLTPPGGASFSRRGWEQTTSKTVIFGGTQRGIIHRRSESAGWETMKKRMGGVCTRGHILGTYKSCCGRDNRASSF